MRVTPRQYEYARLEAAGRSRAEIAARLDVDVNTVCVMMRRLYRRLGVACRRELAEALLACRVREWNGGGRPSRFGLEPGDAVRIVSGRFAGRDGVYVGGSNTHQLRIQIEGGVFALRAAYVQPLERQSRAA